MSSDAQINANRANSQHSTGPKTDAGKAISSHNAVKSALTGRTILLPNDDVPRYEKLTQEMTGFHKPADYMEGLLVQSLIDTEWRLQRIPSLDAALYALAQRELGNTLSEDPETMMLQIEMKYDRQFRNLRLQETRLRRMYREDLARLEKIQAARKEAAEAEAEKAAATEPTAGKPAASPATDPTPATAEIGFQFSTAPKTGEQAA
jgi:hypothetical protein